MLLVSEEIHSTERKMIMKKLMSLCVVMTIIAIASISSFADSGASHSYKSHKETASVTAPGTNYSIYVGVEVWNGSTNLKYNGGSKTTTMYSRTLTKSVSHSSANKGYHTYMTKNSSGTVVQSLSHYGWDT